MAIEGLHWKTARPQDYEHIETFLKKHEPYLVAAASRFIQYKNRTLGKGKTFPGRDQMLLGLDRAQHIQAFLFRSGQILHPFFLNYEKEQASRITRRFINLPFSKRIYSLQGLKEDVEITEEALEQEGYHIQDQFDYYLMHLSEPVRLPPKPEGLTLIDNPAAEQVYPLQAAYEQEEVIPAHSTFHEAHCRLGLERILAEELLIFAEYGGVSAAKANTNARAYTCRQIGGVYVQPRFRGKGIGTYVVAKLVEQVQKEGCAVGLFVKKQNLPAIRVYEKLGFTPIGSYRINYY
mgnify:CR=1 FL=1